MQSGIQLTRNDEYDVHSQFGEDGILAKIIGSLGIRRGTAVEFGAWDGIHLSNTANLRPQGWKTVLIEADEERFALLRTLENERTIAIRAMVEPTGANSLDAILHARGIDDVDLLCIDIDGGDLDILRMLRCRPRIICIEFNPGIPPPYRFSNPAGQCKGSSLASTVDAAAEKQYTLVYATYCNAFFVRNEDCAALEAYDMYHAFHIWDRPAISYMYDGEFVAVGGGNARIVRHPATTVPVFMPRLPKALLGWPTAKTKVAASYLFCALAAPVFYIRELFMEISRQINKSRSAKD